MKKLVCLSFVVVFGLLPVGPSHASNGTPPTVGAERVGCIGHLALEAEEWTKHPFLKTLATAAKVPLFPAYLALKLAVRGVVGLVNSSARSLISPAYWRSDILAFLIYSGLVAANASPAEFYNRVLIGNQHTAMVSGGDYDTSKGPVVGYNAVPEKSGNFSPYQYLTGATVAKNDRKFVHLQTADFKQAVRDIVAASEKVGPIQRWIIAAEGPLGNLFMDPANPNDDINFKWIAANREFLEAVPAGTFAPGAEVILLAAEPPSLALNSDGLAMDGAVFAKELFTPLLKRGGRVKFSTRAIYVDRAKIPEEYRGTDGVEKEAQGNFYYPKREFIEAGLGVYTTYGMVRGGGDTIDQKVRTVEIAPR